MRSFFEPLGEALRAVTMTTVQHALLRSIEATFRLEEDEILAEPKPTRDVRNGFLFPEPTDGRRRSQRARKRRGRARGHREASALGDALQRARK